MIDSFEVVAQRLAADGDAMLDEFRGFAQRQRVAFDSVGSVGQIDVVGFLQREQNLS